MASKLQRELSLLITAQNLSGSVIRGLKGELKGLEGVAGKATTNAFRNIERGAVIAGGAAAAGIGLAIDAAIDWEDQFAGVQKTVDEADLSGGFPKLEADLREMARTLPLAHEELAAVAEQAGALGVAGNDILEFTRITSLLGVTTDVSAQDAATALGQLSNVLDLSNADYERFGSTLVDLGNKGASTESQILGIASRSGAASHLIGMANDETLAWASAVANLGMEEEAAGSSLQRFFLGSLEMISAGGDELEVFADTAKMSVGEFQRLFEKDASGALTTFIDGLGDLDQAEQLAVLDALGFTDVRISRALLGLAGDTDNLEDSLDTANTAWDRNNALQVEADKRFRTTRSQVQKLKNNLQDAGITIGDELLPLFNELVGDATTWLQENPDAIREFGQDLAGGLRDAVTWAQSLDWDKIGDTVETLGDAGAALGKGFMDLPSWVQAFLIGGFAANKFTGGALGDLIGMVGKGVIKGVMNMNAGVVNINAGKVVGGGPGLPGGGGKGGGRNPFPWLPWGIGAGVIPAAVAGGLTQGGSDFTGTPQAQQQLLVTDLWERGLLTDEQYKMLFKLAYEGVDVGPQLAKITGGTGPFAGLMNMITQAQQVAGAASSDKAMLQQAVKDGVSTLPDTAMMQSGFDGVERQVAALPPIMDAARRAASSDAAMLRTATAAVAAKADRQAALAREAVSFDRAQLSRLAVIAAKDLSVAVTVNTNVQTYYDGRLAQATQQRGIIAAKGRANPQIL